MSATSSTTLNRRWWTTRLAATGAVLGVLATGMAVLPFLTIDREVFEDTVRASITTGETQASGYKPSLSADGNRVAFLSSSNQLPGYNGNPQVYARDLQSGITTLVSRTASGAPGNSLQDNPVISADGTKVAFESMSTNLDDGGENNDTNNVRDIYLTDLQSTAAPIRVSRGVSGQLPNAPGHSPTIDGDGSRVGWVTEADNLDPVNDPAAGDNPNVFVRDVDAGTTRMVSIHNWPVGLTHDPANANQLYGIIMARQAMSDDGRWVVLRGERRGGPFQHDPCSGTYAKRELWVADVDNPGFMTRLVNVDDGCNGVPVISGDGSTVVFLNRASDGFRWLPPTGGAHSPITLMASGAPNATVSHPVVSGDGMTIGFDSTATNLVGGDTNAAQDVFVVSRDGAQISRVSVAADGGQADQPATGNKNSSSPDLSHAGYNIAFTSRASDLVTSSAQGGSDTNGADDVFIRSVEPEFYELKAIRAMFGFRDNGWVAGDPVNTATGNMVETHTDLAFPSNTFGLDWARTYNSRDTHTGPLGRGWTGSFDASVFELADGDVTFTGDDGRVVTFEEFATDDWSTPFEIYGDLQRNPNGTLRLDYINGETWTFDTNGRLATKTTADGQTVTITRNPDGTPATATASNGATLTFAWDGLTGRLMSVTAGDGRTVAYGYTADERHALATVTDPAGAEWSTTADDLGRITEARDPEGRLLNASVYDRAGRVTSQTTPDGSTITFSYNEEDGTTVMTDGASGDVNRYAHDRLGQILRITDANGNTVHRAYDPTTGTRTDATDRTGTHVDQTFTADRQLAGRTAVGVNSDGSNRSIAYTYDTDHRATTITETGPDGPLVTTFTYTGENRTPTTITGPATPTDPAPPVTTIELTSGLVTRTTDPDGVVTSYDWDPVTRQLLAVIVAPGTADESTTTFTYTPQGWPETVTTDLGHQTVYTYDTAGRVLTRRDPTGAEWTTTYDDAGNTLTETDPTGAVTTWTYNDAGRVATVTDPRGKTTRHSYNDAGDLTAVAAPDDDTNPANNPTTTYEYGPLARLDAVTDPTGVTTSYEYDNNGRLTVTRNEDGAEWTTTYWPDGKIRSRTHPETGVGEETEYFYDTAGRLARVVDAAGVETTYTYDARGNLIETTGPRAGQTETRSYTPSGRLETVTDGEGNTTRYTYDAAGRAVTVTRGESTSQAATTSTDYDRDGRVIGQVTPEGRTTTFSYDPAGRLLTQTRPDGGIHTSTWTTRGELATSTDAEGGVVGYTYDPAGNLATVTDANANTTSYTYDARGNRTQRVNALGGTDTWTYDLADRMRTHTDPNGVTATTRAYDDLGRLATITDATGRVGTISYDDADRAISRTWVHGPDTLTHSTGYDPNGRIATRTGPDGVTNYSYDPAGSLTAVNAPGVERDFTQTWDLAGRRTALTGPAGTTTATFDPLSRLATVTNPAIGTTTYTWNADSQLLAEELPGPDGRTWTYDAASGEPASYTQALAGTTTSVTLEHDGNGRLTRAADIGGPDRRYAYDPAGQLIEATADSVVTEAYTYDALGRRATSIDATGAHQYRYDPASRLLARITPDPDYAITVDVDINGTVVGSLAGHAEGDTSYTYDTAGRRLTSNTVGTGTTSYDWDPAGRLAIVDAPDATIERTYSGDGQLATVSTDGTQSEIAWDPTSRSLARVGAASLVDGVGHLAAVGDGSGLMGRDHLGSATSGPLALSATYDPYGAAADPGSPTTSPAVGYRGELSIEGVIHLRARDYDPVAGVFLSVDPLYGVNGTATLANPYHYANNDPLNQVDPLGLRPTDDSLPCPSGTDPIATTPSTYDYLNGNGNGSMGCQAPSPAFDWFDFVPDCFSWQENCESLISSYSDGRVCAARYDEGCVSFREEYPWLYQGLQIVVVGALVVATAGAGLPILAGCVGGGGVAMVVTDANVEAMLTGCAIGASGSAAGGAGATLFGATARPIAACLGAGTAAQLLTASNEAALLSCAGSGGTAAVGGGFAADATTARCVIRAMTTRDTWSGDLAAAAAACARGAGQGAGPPSNG